MCSLDYVTTCGQGLLRTAYFTGKKQGIAHARGTGLTPVPKEFPPCQDHKDLPAQCLMHQGVICPDRPKQAPTLNVVDFRTGISFRSSTVLFARLNEGDVDFRLHLGQRDL